MMDRSATPIFTETFEASYLPVPTAMRRLCGHEHATRQDAFNCGDQLGWDVDTHAHVTLSYEAYGKIVVTAIRPK